MIEITNTSKMPDNLYKISYQGVSQDRVYLSGHFFIGETEYLENSPKELVKMVLPKINESFKIGE